MKTQSARYLPTILIFLSFITHYSFAGSDNNEKAERRGPPQFSQLDLDGNGEISLAEFKEHQPPLGTSEEFFSRIDIDEDGVITKSELTNHKPPKCCRDKNNR